MATPYSVPQDFATTLNVGGGIDSSQTSGIVLTSVTGLPTDGGILCFDWASTLDTSVAEYIEYTGISGNTLTGVVRGAEGFTAHIHLNSCTVVGIVSQAHIKRLKDKLTGTDLTVVQDTSGNEILKSAFVTSAVNETTITNAATGNGPQIAATGSDSNIPLNIDSKGTGLIKHKHATYQDFQTYTPTAAGTATLDLSLGNTHNITMPAGNITIALSNAVVGQKFIINITQDSSGSRTVTWFTTIKWASGSIPTLTTTANKRDKFGFEVISSGNYDGVVIGQNF